MQAALDALHFRTIDRLEAFAEQVATGALLPVDFGDAVASLLEAAHTEAVVIGRTHAGDPAPEEADDRLFGESVVDEEAEYLAGFVRDLEAGRYLDDAGEVRRAALSARARAYAGRLVGTANEAWGLTLPPETTLFTWHLADHEDACDACPTLAARGPYRIETIPTWPGKNQTPCLWHCRCVVTTVSGARGFVSPERE